MNGKHTSEAKRILWFAPTAGLWASAELENDLANAWARAGHEITVIRCRGVLKSYCPVMTAEGIAPNATQRAKKVACTECRFNSALLDNPLNAEYSTLWLDEFVTDEMQKSGAETLATVTKENWRDLALHGIPIGRYSSYSTLLHHKVPSPAVSDLAWIEYMSDLFNALLVSQAMPAIFREVDPELVVVYNPLYPINRAFTEFARARNISLLSITAGGFTPDRYSTIALYPRIYSGQTARDSTSISQGLEEVMSLTELAEVTRHVGHQIQGNDPWVYTSSPTDLTTGDIRRRLGLRSDAPVVVVLVGSPDETRSSELVDAERARTDSGISDVLEFIEQALLVARTLPHVDFVIRLHPRLAANKRENFDSPDLIDINRVLEESPPNAHINSPGDGIGLYDTARIASLGLNHASTSGLEFLLLGIPVVHYDPPRLNAYPPEFGRTVQRFDTEALADAISASISEGWSIQHSVRAYRWLATNLLRALIHRNSLDNGMTETLDSMPSPTETPRKSRVRELIPRLVREKISRIQARRARALEFKRKQEICSPEEQWRIEACDRLSALPDSEIWEPLIIQRGIPLTQDAEITHIHLEVKQLIDQLGGLEITNFQRE